MAVFKVAQLEVGGFDHNFSYYLTADGVAGIVDPCGDIEVIQATIRQSACELRYLFLTHSHRDHIEHVDYFRAHYPDIKVISQKTVFNHQLIPFGSAYCEVVFTPGHSTDSIVLRTSDNTALFTGDTLFIDCCGFCEPTSMWNTLHNIIKELPNSLEVYSGHDYGVVKHRSLGEEKQHNPYLNAPNFETFKSRLKDL